MIKTNLTDVHRRQRLSDFSRRRRGWLHPNRISYHVNILVSIIIILSIIRSTAAKQKAERSSSLETSRQFVFSNFIPLEPPTLSNLNFVFSGCKSRQRGRHWRRSTSRRCDEPSRWTLRRNRQQLIDRDHRTAATELVQNWKLNEEKSRWHNRALPNNHWQPDQRS